MRNQEFFVVEMIGVKRFFYADLAVWLAFPCVVFAIWCADCDLLIGDSWTAFRVQCVLNAIAAVLGIAMLTLRYRETGRTFWNRAALGLSAAGIALLLLSWNFLCLLLDEGQEYHSFSSPDGSHRGGHGAGQPDCGRGDIIRENHSVPDSVQGKHDHR